jgi:hypothetical protein
MNNNPFEPVTTEPSDGNPPLTDNAADNFSADNNNLDADSASITTRPAALSIDGISPSYDDDNSTKVLKIDEDGNSTVKDATSSNDILNDDHAGDFLGETLADESNETNSPSIETADPPKTDTPEVETPTPAAPPPAKIKPAKPTKTIKISLLTIIFLILALLGIGGTVWFYLQNNKNIDALESAKTEVQQLKDDLATTSSSENTTAGQYDGLNTKIEDLSGQNEEIQKTIDDYKKKNEDLTKQVADLTTERDNYKKQADNISGLTTKLDTLLSNCKVTTSGNVQSCTVTIP